MTPVTQHALEERTHHIPEGKPPSYFSRTKHFFDKISLFIQNNEEAHRYLLYASAGGSYATYKIGLAINNYLNGDFDVTITNIFIGNIALLVTAASMRIFVMEYKADHINQEPIRTT